VGIQGRDWYRTNSSRGGGRGLVAGVVIGLVLILAASPEVSQRLGYTPPFGVAGLFPGDQSDTSTLAGLLPDVPSPTPGSLSAPDDPWQAWLADERTCPGGEDASATSAAQAQVMLCLVNYARAREGVRPLLFSEPLNASAAAKARDIVGCREFSHEACGRPSNATLRDVGYRGTWGENLYVAEGPLVAPRPALDGWLNSHGHRENLFRPEWRTIGIAALGGVELERIEHGVVWVNHFGD
jgi:uncharacterized protein YkwD